MMAQFDGTSCYTVKGFVIPLLTDTFLHLHSTGTLDGLVFISMFFCRHASPELPTIIT